MLEKPTMKRTQQKIWQSQGLAAKGPSKRLFFFFFKNFPLIFSLGRRNQSRPIESFQFVSSAANCVYLSPESHVCLLSLPFLSSLVCVYTVAAKGILLTWEPVGWQHRVDVERPTLSLPEVWPVLWCPAHSGERERDYISWLWKEVCCLPCICPLGVKNKAESKWILLVDPEIFASSS